MRKVRRNYYPEDEILFNVNENSLFFSSLAFIKKILASISQILRYFESLRYYFLTSRRKGVLYLNNSKKFESLNIVLRSSFTIDGDDLNRFKIIEKD